LTTLDTTNRLGRYIVSELALPLKDKSPGAYNFFSNRWVASLVVAIFGVGLGWSGQYSVLWPAFAGANQLVASVTMITVALWIKRKLDKKYTNVALIPAILLWITVTAGLVWYEIVVIPPMIIGEGVAIKEIITGLAVGVITLIMLILNFTMIINFFKGFGKKGEPEVSESTG
jgi:carbon starvation protein